MEDHTTRTQRLKNQRTSTIAACIVFCCAMVCFTAVLIVSIIFE